MGTAQVRAQYMHSKAVIGSELGMIGSYNYTYASRFRHAEDGFVFDESLVLENACVWPGKTERWSRLKSHPLQQARQDQCCLVVKASLPKEPKISNGRQKI